MKKPGRNVFDGKKLRKCLDFLLKIRKFEVKIGIKIIKNERKSVLLPPKKEKHNKRC